MFVNYIPLFATISCFIGKGRSTPIIDIIDPPPPNNRKKKKHSFVTNPLNSNLWREGTSISSSSLAKGFSVHSAPHMKPLASEDQCYFVVSHDLLIIRTFCKKAGGSMFNIYLYVNFRKFQFKKRGEGSSTNSHCLCYLPDLLFSCYYTASRTRFFYNIGPVGKD